MVETGGIQEIPGNSFTFAGGTQALKVIPFKSIAVLDGREDFPEPEENALLSRRRVPPGVILLDSDGTIHFLNGTAKRFLSLHERKRDGYGANALSLPPILFEFYMQSKNMTPRSRPVDPGLPSLSRHEIYQGAPYLLRSIFLEPAEVPSDRTYFMVLIEALPRNEQAAPDRAVSLSRQEQRVVQLLSKGKKNKTIALAMGLSDYTVREYIKRIMRKLNVTTRSGIVAKSLT